MRAARLCEELAGAAQESKRSVARNGTIIEQEQILTTHNLAVLFHELRHDEHRRRQAERVGAAFG